MKRMLLSYFTFFTIFLIAVPVAHGLGVWKLSNDDMAAEQKVPVKMVRVPGGTVRGGFQNCVWSDECLFLDK
ncbi:MAG: hypothetical protein IJU95_06225, partial [Treponema sp.]|nr:hypothetical protein [Treponema sp.]